LNEDADITPATFGARMLPRQRLNAKGMSSIPTLRIEKRLTRRHSLDYIFQLAVEMHKLGLPWIPK